MRVETISSESEFAKLAAQWDELVRAMPRPSPFLLHGWLTEWWRHYGDGGDLAVHVAYRGDRLVGALPFYSRRRPGVRVTEFIGGTWALLADVLVAPGEDAAIATPLLEAARSSEHDFVNLFGLPGSSRLVAALPRDALCLVERLEAPILDLSAGWEVVYPAKLTSKARSERRRRRRQLQELGAVEVAVARTRQDLGPALEEAFRLHVLRWHGRRDGSGFATDVGRRFHRDALLGLADLDLPRLVTLSVDGRPIAFALSFHFEQRAYGVTMAFDPAYARYAPGFEAKLLSIETAADEGIRHVELLGAAAAHKRRFTDRLEPIYQGIGLAASLRGRIAAKALVDGIHVRRALKRSKRARQVYYRIPLLSR